MIFDIVRTLPPHVRDFLHMVKTTDGRIAKVLMERGWKQTTNQVNFQQIDLYEELIREELVIELIPALVAWKEDPLNLAKIKRVLDGIGDVKVTVDGLAWSFGINPEDIKDRVDLSNITKIPAPGEVLKRREDGKVLKPEGFQEPVLDDLGQKVIDSIVGAK